MPKTKTPENPLFGKFDDVVRSVLNTPHIPKNPLRFADMFCGIGGFHVAASSLGMKCVFACDIDEDCRKAYEHNFGLKPESDICRIEPKDVPAHDVLFAGFPCQPFSIIGNREGFSDARGTLFFELARIIEEKQPSCFILENVKQLRTHNNGKTLKRIIEILTGLGYWTDHRVLNALNFGLPHKRERILIVGIRGAIDSFPWPEKKEKMQPLSSILEKNPDESSFVSERILRARKAAHKPKVTPSIWHENKAGNISSHPFSCALRAGASYNYLLVNGERRLTPREMLRLQGFPDTYQLVCTDSQTRKQAGNSVPVPMVKAVLKQLLHVQAQAQTTGKLKAA